MPKQCKWEKVIIKSTYKTVHYCTKLLDETWYMIIIINKYMIDLNFRRKIGAWIKKAIKTELTEHQNQEKPCGGARKNMLTSSDSLCYVLIIELDVSNWKNVIANSRYFSVAWWMKKQNWRHENRLFFVRIQRQEMNRTTMTRRRRGMWKRERICEGVRAIKIL